MTKRGYLISSPTCGEQFGVVASTAKNAKVMGWNRWEFDLECAYIEMRAVWRREAQVDSLPLGPVEDSMVALRHKLIDWLGEA